MVNSGSLPQGGQSVFDFETQAGITHVLSSIRAAAASTEVKSELRDLVFLYTNGGKDERVRTTLEQKITAAGIAPAPKKVTIKPQPEPEPPTIGKFRSAPSFGVKSTVVAAPEIPKPDFTQDKTWKAEPVVETSTPVIPAVDPVPAPVVPPVPVQEAEPVPPVQVVSPSTPPIPATIPEPVMVATPTEIPSIDGEQEAILKRIREIKSLVNEKVGNPVNLVDINNEVGREYMSALLDAMKKVNSGSSATSAMARLESAYAAVEQTLENRNVQAPPPRVENEPSVPSHQEVPPVAAAAFVSPEPVPVSTIPPAIPEVAPVSPIASEPVTPPSIAESVNRIPVKNFATTEEENRVEPVNISSSLADTLATKREPEVYTPPAATPVPAPPPPPPQPVSPSPVTQSVKPLASLADLREMELPKSEVKPEAVPVVNGDPLNSPDVEAGLEQLLEEWPIFKKSGLFGTGPKGKEHPLFKKMAPLQIPLLLAGRFEGATQEIKQSITDYMNGWRYEQGLIYEQGETFEHYLRRVIRHILDLQKSRL